LNRSSNVPGAVDSAGATDVSLDEVVSVMMVMKPI
jgi:hypothetical protein